MLFPRRSFVATAAVLLCCACSAAPDPRSESPQPAPVIEVVLFPLSAAAPIYVGVDHGFYSRAGLDVRLTATPDSAHLISGLTSGRYQFGAALIDNFVAYAAGQHAVPHQEGRDLCVLMGLSTASAALVARGDIASIDQLRGRRVGVDAPGTGFAFMLYRMTAQASLRPTDYQLVASGSTKTRWEALARGDIDATILTPEFVAQAKERGLNVLSDSRALFKSYMGAAVAADPAWARMNSRSTQAFLRATLEARQWLDRPENLPLAAASLSKRLGGTHEQMTLLLRGMLDNSVLIRDGDIDSRGLSTVVELRKQYASGLRAASAPHSYLDLSYLASAREELGNNANETED